MANKIFKPTGKIEHHKRTPGWDLYLDLRNLMPKIVDFHNSLQAFVTELEEIDDKKKEEIINYPYNKNGVSYSFWHYEDCKTPFDRAMWLKTKFRNIVADWHLDIYKDLDIRDVEDRRVRHG